MLTYSKIIEIFGELEMNKFESIKNYKIKEDKITAKDIFVSLLIISSVIVSIVFYSESMKNAYQSGVNDAYYDLGNSSSQGSSNNKWLKNTMCLNAITELYLCIRSK